MTQPQSDPAALAAQYLASGEPPDGPLGTALYHHRAQPDVRRELLARLTPETPARERAAALAWIGRYQGARSIQARQFVRLGLLDPEAGVRRAALRQVGNALAGRPDAAKIAESEIAPHTQAEREPDWLLRLTAWGALNVALREDPLPRFLAVGGDPEPRVEEGVRLLSRLWLTRSNGDMTSAGGLNGQWEALIASAEPPR